MSFDHDPPPRVSIQPASFNKSSTLGRVAQITYNPTADQITVGIKQEQNLIQWQGRKTEAQALTIDVGTVLTPVPTPHAVPRPSARPYIVVQYGVDGNIQNSVTVDVGTGRRITVVANYVSVNVGMDPPLIGQPSPVLAYGASLGTFAAPSVAPLIRSTYIDDLASGTHTDFIQVPLRANMLLLPAPIASPGGATYGGVVTINFFDFGGSPVGQWTWDFGTGIGLVPAIPVPLDAWVFNLITSVDNTYLRVPFQLSL